MNKETNRKEAGARNRKIMMLMNGKEDEERNNDITNLLRDAKHY